MVYYYCKYQKHPNCKKVHRILYLTSYSCKILNYKLHKLPICLDFSKIKTINTSFYVCILYTYTVYKVIDASKQNTVCFLNALAGVSWNLPTKPNKLLMITHSNSNSTTRIISGKIVLFHCCTLHRFHTDNYNKSDSYAQNLVVVVFHVGKMNVRRS